MHALHAVNNWGERSETDPHALGVDSELFYYNGVTDKWDTGISVQHPSIARPAHRAAL